MRKLFAAAIAVVFMSTAAYSQVFHLDTVYFDFDKHELKPEARSTLVSLVDIIMQKENSRIYLRGHTDGRGTNLYNDQLAERRVTSVKDYLVKAGIPASRIIPGSFGENRPVASNNKDADRALNRRVEITCVLPAEVAAAAKKVQESPANKELPEKEKDVIIYGPGGTEIEIKAGAFCEHDIKDIRIDVKAALTKGDMISQGVVPFDNDGRCLISGGMVFVSATLNGKPIQPCKDSMLKIRVPVTSFDAGMNVYTAERSEDGQLNWENREDKPQLTERNGRTFYEFPSNTFSSFNLDKLPLAAPVVAAPLALISLIQSVFAEEGLVVKTRKYRYDQSYIVSESVAGIAEGELFRKDKKALFTCDECVPGQRIYVGIFKEDGRSYMVKKPLTALRYNRFLNRYVVRKRDYFPVNDKRIERELAKL